MADGAIRVKSLPFPITPNPPAGRYYIGVDSADGHLKKQDSTGAVTDYDSGSVYTDEQAQDAVGNILQDTASVDLSYNDAGPGITATVIPGGVNHNLLGNFSPNTHVDHTAVSVATPSGSGLAGGGDISATRSLSVDIATLTEKQLPSANDMVMIYDSASPSLKKMRTDKFNRKNVDTYTERSSDFVVDHLDGLTATTSGAGSSAQTSVFGIDLTENARGVGDADTGTTAGGRVTVGSATFTQLFLASGDAYRFQVRYAPELLSTGTETFTCYVGFIDNSGAGDQVDGAYFRYTDSVNGGRWEAVVSSASTRQAFDTGILADVNYHIFEVRLDWTGGSPTALFFIDGVQVASATSPTNPVPNGPTNAFGYGWKIEKSAGTTARFQAYDWYTYEYLRTTSR